MNRYYVSPCFTITKEGNYSHIKPETPITVKDTVNTRGSILKDTSVDWLEEANQKMESKVKKGLRGK